MAPTRVRTRSCRPRPSAARSGRSSPTWPGPAGSAPGAPTPRTCCPGSTAFSGGCRVIPRWGGRPCSRYCCAGGSFLGKRVATPDGLVDLAPADLVADLVRLEAAEADLSRTGVLRLIGRRDRRSHNSWMHNNAHITQPDGNVALLHPADAAERGIADGAHVEVRGAAGAVRLPVSLTSDVARGVVVVPHGWGHATTGPRRARGLAGVNINGVIPGGAAHMDPVSGQAVMLAHEVEVSPV